MIDERDDYGRTLLHRLEWKKTYDVDFAEWIVHLRPKMIRMKDIELGRTPIMIACANGNLGIAQLLYGRQRETLDDIDNYGDTVMHRTVSHVSSDDRRDVVNWLWSVLPQMIDAVNNNGRTPFLYACA